MNCCAGDRQLDRAGSGRQRLTGAGADGGRDRTDPEIYAGRSA